MEANRRQPEAEETAETEAKTGVPEPVEGESSIGAPPLAESFQQPAKETPISKYLADAASFLGKTKEELEKLDPGAVATMINDRASLYNQKQMGSGEHDAAIRQFTASYDMGVNSLDTAASASVTDRRQAIRIDQPLPSRRTPTLNQPAAIDMKQVANLVEQMIGDMEPRFASRIYRQLEQSLYA